MSMALVVVSDPFISALLVCTATLAMVMVLASLPDNSTLAKSAMVVSSLCTTLKPKPMYLGLLVCLNLKLLRHSKLLLMNLKSPSAMSITQMNGATNSPMAKPTSFNTL